MKRFLPIILISTVLFASSTKKEWVDLGKEGHLYPIVERNFLLDIQEGVEEVQKKLTKEHIRKILVKEIRRRATGHTKLGMCQQDSKSVEPNVYTVQEDIYNPAGRLYKKKGEKILVKNEIPVDICFISGDNMKTIDNQIKFYDRVVKRLSGENAECIYMVSNRNVLQLNKKYKPKMFFPTGEGYEETLGIRCYPTLIHLKGDKKYRFELNMKRFQHNER